jgi:hypothetical protein
LPGPIQQKSYANYFFWVSGSGLLLKLIYLFIIGPGLFAHELLINNDTVSYTDSFINLIKNGTYTHTPGYEPASYGRLPGLPFIWGFFYLIFGLQNSYWAFAVFQVLLDALVCRFLYRIAERLFSSRTALGVVALYVPLPLTFYYVTKTGTEYLSWFVCISVFYQLVFFKAQTRNVMMLSLTLVVGFYVRETLLLLVPLSLFYLNRHYAFSIRNVLLGITTFLLIYLPWPIRNYFNYQKIIPVKELSAGYRSYNTDITSFMYWMYAWHDSNIMDYFDAAYNDKAAIKFPEEIFNTPTEEKLAYDLILLGRSCGSSFIDWKRIAELPHRRTNCNYDQLITNGFRFLEESYASSHPFTYYVKVPLLNAKKALFIGDISSRHQQIPKYSRIIFILRTIMILLGIFACVIFWRHDFFKLLFIFFIISLVFFCAVLRQVEVRYLYPSDAMLWIASSCLLMKKLFKAQETSQEQ